MKTLQIKTTVKIMVGGLGISLFLMANSLSFASMEDQTDKTDKLSDNSSYVFAPGYINAAKAKTEAVAGQLNGTGQFLLNKGIDYNPPQIPEGLIKKSEDTVKPVLQQKTSSTNQAQTTIQANTIEASSGLGNINIGHGTNQVKEGNRVISEVFEGTRYIYAGFDNVGKTNLSDALAIANSGDKIVVKGGKSYDMIGNINVIKNGVSMYGSYDENGNQNTATPTVIYTYDTHWTINQPTEINGFVFDVAQNPGLFGNNWLLIRDSSNLVFRNDTFNEGLETHGSTVLFDKNSFNGGAGFCQSKITITNNNFSGGFLFIEGSYAYDTSSGNYYTTSSNNNFSENYNIMEWGEAQEGGPVAPIFYSTNDYFAGGNTAFNANNNAFSEDPMLYTNTFVTDPAARPNTAGIEDNSPLTNNTITTLYNPYYNPRYDNRYSSYGLYPNLSSTAAATLETNITTSLFKNMLANNIISNEGGAVDVGLLEKLVNKAIGDNGLGTSITDELRAGEMETAIKLADILKNPTKDQKKLLDVVESILNEVSKVEGENISPELQKAQNDMLEVVAKTLLAQAMPGLIKEGDISGIKNLFNDLTEQNTAIMSAYQEATLPYYEAIKDLFANNMDVLSNSGIVSKDMLEKELSKASPNQLEKILERLRAKQNKSKDEEAILREEAKYRQQYLDPNKKVFEEQVKAMLKDFTNKMNTALKGTGTVDKK